MATSKWEGSDWVISLGWAQARTAATPMIKNTVDNFFIFPLLTLISVYNIPSPIAGMTFFFLYGGKNTPLPDGFYEPTPSKHRPSLSSCAAL
jgi:hypothetical protein